MYTAKTTANTNKKGKAPVMNSPPNTQHSNFSAINIIEHLNFAGAMCSPRSVGKNYGH